MGARSVSLLNARGSQNIRPVTCIISMLMAEFPRGDDSEPEREAQKARFLVSGNHCMRCSKVVGVRFPDICANCIRVRKYNPTNVAPFLKKPAFYQVTERV